MWFLPEVIAYLTEQLGIQVSTTIPENRPSRAVTVVRTGGRGDRFTERPRVDVNTWGTTDLEAMELMGEVCDALLCLPDHSENIAYVEQGSVYSEHYEDGTPRWGASFSFVINR